MMAATQPTLRSEPAFIEKPTFDEVVFGEGDEQQRMSFNEFRGLPLRHRVHLLLSKVPHFFLAGVEIPRVEAMRFAG